MIHWQITPLKLALNYTWKISRNTSTHKTNFLIGCDFKRWKGIGEVAPNIRYQETPEVIMQEFELFVRSGGNDVADLTELTALLDKLKLKNALRFGIESAYIHMLCHAEQTSLNDFLHIPPASDISTSYTMPILDIGEVTGFYERNNLQRFKIIKLKTNAENGLGLLQHFSGISNQPLIIDANEAFTNADDLLKFMRALRPYNILLIEQPMPAHCTEDYKTVKREAIYPLMADESVCDDADFDDIALQFDCVNMKLMKAGGYLNGLRILNEARSRGLQTMVGCMVETSLGISGAFHMSALTEYADLDGFMIVKDEPLGLLKEKDGIINLDHSL